MIHTNMPLDHRCRSKSILLLRPPREHLLDLLVHPRSQHSRHRIEYPSSLRLDAPHFRPGEIRYLCEEV